MFHSIVLNIKKERYNQYCEAFNFFQSKSINMIISSRKLVYVVNFRDLEFFDDETEYYKRYYNSSETSTRLRKLTNYYEINMTPPIPNLLPIHNYHILENRNRKILKLCIMRERSLAKKNSAVENEEESSRKMILQNLDDSNLSAETSQKESQSQNMSYDSDPHNAYEQLERNALENSSNKLIELINLKDIGQSYLVLDFKVNVQKPLAIAPPIVVLPEKITASIAVQTMPIEIAPQKKMEKEMAKEKEKEKEKLVIRPVAIPELKKQMSSPNLFESGFRSEIKAQNMIFTSSIEIIPEKASKQQKRKPSTFMQYYNSVPVKNPSNILERYIKRKK